MCVCVCVFARSQAGINSPPLPAPSYRLDLELVFHIRMYYCVATFPRENRIIPGNSNNTRAFPPIVGVGGVAMYVFTSCNTRTRQCTLLPYICRRSCAQCASSNIAKTDGEVLGVRQTWKMSRTSAKYRATFRYVCGT